MNIVASPGSTSDQLFLTTNLVTSHEPSGDNEKDGSTLHMHVFYIDAISVPTHPRLSTCYIMSRGTPEAPLLNRQ